MITREEFKSVKIPVMNYKPVSVHEDYPWIKDKCEEFINTFGLQADRQNEYQYAYMFAICYSKCVTREKLLNLANFNQILFVIDDEIEERGKREYKAVEKLVYELIFAIKYPDSPTNHRIKKSNKFVAALLDVWPEILKDFTAVQREYFVEPIIDYFSLNLYCERHNRQKAHFIGMTNFIEIRRADACVWQMIVFVEYAVDVDLFGALSQFVDVKNLHLLSLDHVMLSNDIVSLKRELLKGEIMNYVMAYAFEHKCPLQVAVDRCLELLVDIENQMLAIVESIKANRKLVESEPKVVTYLDALMDMCYGHLKWCQESTRYDVTDKQIKNSDFAKINKSMSAKASKENEIDLSEIIGYNVNYYRLK